MSTVIYVGSAGDPSQFSITENGKFNIETRIHVNQLGYPDTQETFIEIEGDLVQGGSLSGGAIGTSPGGIFDAMTTVSTQAGDRIKNVPRPVYIQVDGVTKFDFEPSACINSPIITGFRTITDTGAGDAHWKYGMTVYVRQLMRPDGVLAFTSSIATTTLKTSNGDQPVRKVWNASCAAGNVATAYAFIQGLAPSAPVLRATLARFFQEGRATGEWVWDYNQQTKIVEEIQVVGLGPTYGESTQVSADGSDVMPLIYRQPRRAIRVLLNGTISSMDKSLVTQPELHWAEGDTGSGGGASGSFFHDLGNEEVGYPVIFDPASGIYSLKYQERWIGTTFTDPNHHGHDTIPVLPEPGDGPIAGASR